MAKHWSIKEKAWVEPDWSKEHAKALCSIVTVPLIIMLLVYLVRGELFIVAHVWMLCLCIAIVIAWNFIHEGIECES